MNHKTLIGSVPSDFDTFVLRERLIRNDPGDWGDEPQAGACGVLRGTNFTNEGLLNLEDVALRSLSAEKYSEKRLERSDVIIERSGGSDVQPVGRVGFIDEIISARGYAFSNFVQRITVNDSLNPKFVYYCLQHMYEMGITIAMQSQTTGIRNLDYKLFVRSRLPEPKRSEQDVIVFAIECVDKAIATVRESIGKVERLQKALMQQLLSGKLKADGTARQNNDFRDHSKVGHVPNNWKVSPLKDLAEIQRGKFSYRPRNEPRFFSGPYPFIQTADIVASRGYVRKHSQTLSEEGKDISRMFPAGSVMITIAANIGHTAIAAYDVYATDSVIGISPKEGMDSEFLELCLRMQKGYLQRMATESAQANINYGNLRPLLIAHPETLEEQKAVAAPILSCEKSVFAKQAKIAALQRLKKSLMQNLLTGKVRLHATEKIESLTTTS